MAGRIRPGAVKPRGAKSARAPPPPSLRAAAAPRASSKATSTADCVHDTPCSTSPSSWPPRSVSRLCDTSFSNSPTSSRFRRARRASGRSAGDSRGVGLRVETVSVGEAGREYSPTGAEKSAVLSSAGSAEAVVVSIALQEGRDLTKKSPSNQRVRHGSRRNRHGLVQLLPFPSRMPDAAPNSGAHLILRGVLWLGLALLDVRQTALVVRGAEAIVRAE
eukprot:scaffold84087_cov63-Phaeocystis_antarctica.AAC.1